MTKKYTPRVAYEALLFAISDRDGAIEAQLRDASLQDANATYPLALPPPRSLSTTQDRINR